MTQTGIWAGHFPRMEKWALQYEKSQEERGRPHVPGQLMRAYFSSSFIFSKLHTPSVHCKGQFPRAGDLLDGFAVLWVSSSRMFTFPSKDPSVPGPEILGTNDNPGSWKASQCWATLGFRQLTQTNILNLLLKSHTNATTEIFFKTGI